MLVLVDMDGPLADFERSFLATWRQRYPNRTYIPSEERTAFEFIKEYPAEHTADVKAVYTAPGFIENLPITEGAVEGINKLRHFGHDVWICTAALTQYENCVLEKYRWVERVFGKEMIKRLILTKDKTLVRGDVLIDDKPSITGSFTPTWEHIIFDKPYNRSSPGRRMTWETLDTIIQI